MLDKTGTITLGNRRADEFIPVDGAKIEELADAAQLASLADETPEGRSIVVLAKQRFGLRGRELSEADATFVPFSAKTRMMDVRLIVQVVVNLVNNAIQHTPKGSTIHISSSSQEGRAVIEVADDGPGIADDEKARVFERFYTVADDEGDHRRGTGLGLALCKSIVSAHGGDIVILDNHPHESRRSHLLCYRHCPYLYGR